MNQQRGEARCCTVAARLPKKGETFALPWTKLGGVKERELGEREAGGHPAQQ